MKNSQHSRSCTGYLIMMLACVFPSFGAESPPNVVILFADDLGYGDLSSYGSPEIRTPNLDRMGQRGARLTSFYAAYACSPSRALLLTGRYPHRHGVTKVFGPAATDGIPADEVTLAEALKSVGYRTAIFGKWHVGHARPEYRPLGKGFDEWFGLPYSNDMIPPWVKTDKPLRLWEGDAEYPEVPVVQETLTERYTERAVKFIRQNSDTPFFLYVPYAMPHLPISASEKFRGRSTGGLYGDVIETIDWSAGEIVSALREEGLEENTLVVFTSDNGPWLNLPDRMLAGGVEPWHAGSPGAFRGAKGTTYEGGVRVPCVIQWPGTIPAGQQPNGMASVLDIYATCVAVAGAKLPEGHVLDGHDLMPLLRDGKPSPRTEIFHFRGSNLEAVREDDWKLRVTKAEGTQLFHMLRDSSERYNMAEAHPEIVKRLQAKMEALKESAK